MTHVEALTFATVMGMCVSYLLYILPGKCRCESCTFHTNERRMEKLRKAEKAEEDRKANEERVHDYQHKGGAWINGDPDRFPCPDEKCPRNPA